MSTEKEASDIVPNSSKNKTCPSEEQTLATIDAEIRALKTRRNALAKVCRLPPELLSHVFITHAFMHRTCSIREEWIAVTHVCRYWRHITLECSTLWSVIYENFGSAQVREYLHRSKKASLQVPLLPIRAPGGVATIILAELHRIRILSITTSPSLEEWFALWPFLKSPAPILEELTLAGGCGSYTPYYTPECLFGNQFPALKTLRLDHFCLQWGSIVLHGLSELTLLNIPIDRQPSLPDMLKTLEACPELEILRLNDAGPRIITAICSTPPIDLPRLRHLDLYMSSSTCLNLLDRLILPPTVHVDLRCQSYPVRLALPVLPLHIPALMEELVLEVHLFSDCVTLGALLVPPGKPGRKRIVNLEFHWSQNPSAEAPLRDTFNALSSLIGTSGLTHATQLYFCLDGEKMHEVETQSWARLLSTLPRLKLLKIWYNRKDDCVSAETDVAFAVALSERHLGTFPCPQLLTLTMMHFNFSRRRGNFFFELKRCLESRRDHGLPMEQLYISDCNGVVPELLEDLKGLVNNVKWDGRVREEESGG